MRKSAERKHIFGQRKSGPIRISLPTADIPDRPDFCPPFHRKSNPVAWLSAATDGLLTLCEANEVRHLKSIDDEVRAAIYLGVELETNETLHSEWCILPDWSTVSRKRPKKGHKDTVFEEVFRLIWAIRRKDQDGYELRYRAFKACFDPTLSPEEIVQRIRAQGGYRFLAKGKPTARKANLASSQNGSELTFEDKSFIIENVTSNIRRMLLKLAKGEEAWVKVRALGVSGPQKVQRFKIVAKRSSTIKKLDG